MKRFLIPLLAALTIPTAVNAEETIDLEKLTIYNIKYSRANNLLREGKFSEMKNICEDLIEISPDNTKGYVCKGIALGFVSKNKRKSREALKNFTKAIAIDPENYEAYFLRGKLQFTMRRREFSKLQMTGCNDFKKAYLNGFPPAIETVNKNKSFFIKNKCSGFF